MPITLTVPMNTAVTKLTIRHVTIYPEEQEVEISYIDSNGQVSAVNVTSAQLLTALGASIGVKTGCYAILLDKIGVRGTVTVT